MTKARPLIAVILASLALPGVGQAKPSLSMKPGRAMLRAAAQGEPSHTFLQRARHAVIHYEMRQYKVPRQDVRARCVEPKHRHARCEVHVWAQWVQVENRLEASKTWSTWYTGVMVRDHRLIIEAPPGGLTLEKW